MHACPPRLLLGCGPPPLPRRLRRACGQWVAGDLGDERATAHPAVTGPVMAQAVLEGRRARQTHVSDLEVERGHRVLRVTHKGGPPRSVPLAPRTSAALDADVDTRMDGPIFLGEHRGQGTVGRRTSSGATYMVQRVANGAEITNRLSPHSLRHGFVSLLLETGVALSDVQGAAGTPTRAQRAATTEHVTVLTPHLLTRWRSSSRPRSTLPRLRAGFSSFSRCSVICFPHGRRLADPSHFATACGRSLRDSDALGRLAEGAADGDCVGV